MTRFTILRDFVVGRFTAVLMIADLAFNCIVVPLFQLPRALIQRDPDAITSPFETVSARTGRGMMQGRDFPLWFGKWIVDPLFKHLIKQPPYWHLADGRTFNHPSHCVRAAIKLREGEYLPNWYRQPLPQEIESCYRSKK